MIFVTTVEGALALIGLYTVIRLAMKAQRCIGGPTKRVTPINLDAD